MMRAFGTSIIPITTRFRGVASRFAKRAMDITASALALLFLFPFFCLIAIAIKRDSPGPVFYGGPRVGRGGKIFKIWKFRTMYEDERSYQGPRVTARNDERVTPLGHWLRDTKLNELPQFWNVLVGEMSLVGPRPEDPELAKDWPEPVRSEILSVRPGITSPASVQYRNEEQLLSLDNAVQKYINELGPDKLRMDQIYVRHHGFWMDLDTLIWTFLLLLPKIKSYTPPEGLLFVGPVTRLMRRYLNWFTIDALTTFAALGVSGVVWRFSGPLNLGWPRSIAFGVGFALLYSLIAAFFGVNRIAWSKANFTDALDLVPAWFIATLVVFFINTAYHRLPGELIITAALLAMGGYVFTRYRSRLVTFILTWISKGIPGVRQAGERVLIVGAGTAAQQAAWLLTHPDNSNKFHVVGFVDNDIFKLGLRVYRSVVLGTVKEIPALLKKHDIGLVVLAGYHQGGDDFITALRACRALGVRYLLMPNLLSVFQEVVAQPKMVPVTAPGKNGKEAEHLAGSAGTSAGQAAGEAGDPSQDENYPYPCEHCLARIVEKQASMGETGEKTW